MMMDRMDEDEDKLGLLNGENSQKEEPDQHPHVQGRARVPSSDQGEVAGVQAYVTVAILCLVNLLNYIDRYTVAANLVDIQIYFQIEDNNSLAGLIQTVFIVGYMLTSPIFGYLGDRYSRKVIIAFGITMWSILTLAGSFVAGDKFWLFILIRGAVGIGEASYVTIAGTIIGDLFVGNQRSKMLMVFYFAIPVGSGLGYIVGKALEEIFDNWQWALRITPGLGVVCVFLIILVLREPNRGQAETGNQAMANTDYFTDLNALRKNKAYIFSSLGLTSQCWVAGALALWAVETIEYAYELQGLETTGVSFVFGAITCVAGIIGVAAGTSVAQYLRPFNPRADPLVCAFGMLAGAPFLFLGLLVATSSVVVAWAFILISEILLFLNWALIPDMLLYILIPTRRATGNAMQMLMSHLLGDALSPWIIGLISDQIRNSMTSPSSTHDRYYSLVYSLYLSAFVTVLGGGAFLATALYIEKAKARVEEIVQTQKRVDDGALTSDQYVN